MKKKRDPEQQTDETAIAQQWQRELDSATAHERDWRKRAEKVVERYRDEKKASEEETRKPKFNILYANTEVLRGVVYQKTPVPDVRRRFLDKDKLGRVAATVLQRSLSYCVDSYDFDAVMGGVVEDTILPGRGLAKIRYVPTYGPMLDGQGQPMLDDKGMPMQQVVFETVQTDYVEWDMVRISPAKRWAKVRWIAFGELLTRAELDKQFGAKGQACKLDWCPKDKEEEKDDTYKRALVWTIWDKTKKQVVCWSKGLPEQLLSQIDDPLNLEAFFPCPRPVYSVKTTNTMIPVPEYTQYQDQAIELDTLTARIDALVNALRWRGFAGFAEIEKLAAAEDGTFLQVSTVTDLMGKSLKDWIWEAPIETIANVLAGLYKQREMVKQTIYEVTGLADVVRGVSVASETLGAQELKARYANVRTGPRQKEIQRFARDLYRLTAEVIAEKFDAQTLAAMTGLDLCANDGEKQAIQQQVQAAAAMGQEIPPPEKLSQPTWEEVKTIIADDKLRGFRVDIETDSTVEPDASEEQKNRVELLSAITQFVQGVAPAVQTGAIPMELAKEMLTFGVRGFKVSPQLEDALDSIGQNKNQPQDDATKRLQIGLQEAELAKAQAEAREAQAKADEAIAKAQLAQRQLLLPAAPVSQSLAI